MKWFLTFLVLGVILAFLGLWFLPDPGSVTLTWFGYQIQLSAVIGLLLLLFVLLLINMVFRGVSWLVGLPFRWSLFQQRKAKHELLELLSSYEAEIFQEALHHQKKGAKHLSTNPFFLWLSGLTLEKTGHHFEAEKCFMELSKTPSSAFLGLKGQIRAALHRRDFKLAFVLLSHAKKLAPTSPWTLKHLLALAREEKKFAEAESLVLTLEDLGYFSTEQSKKQLALLQYQQALLPKTSQTQKETLLRQSHSLDPSLAEVTETFALLLQKQGHKNHALTAIEATWALAPSQKLGDLYLKISSPETPLLAYQMAQKLSKNNATHPESLLFLARTAFNANLWGETRAHLKKLLKIDGAATSLIYQLFANLELAEFQDWKAAIKWLEEGIQAPRHI